MVKAFAEFVAAQRRHGLWDRNPCDEFRSFAVLFAVGEEEILERQRAQIVAAAQMQGRTHRDQRRRRVANRRAIGDIAANGGSIAHLFAGIAAQQFGKAGVAVL